MRHSSDKNSLQDYELGEQIGAGGMGTVYRGMHIQSGQTVAVKILKAELASPEMIERFTREGEALRTLNHPNIVKMLDALTEDEQHYLVMELVEGGCLRDLLNQTPQLPIQQVLKISLEIADALTRAHHLKIIHRDIKPSNVLLADDGTPRLTDFGIAHTPDSDMTGSGEVLGTVAYLSPELLNGGPASVQSDIWAFGIMLFEMLTGQQVFQGDRIGALVTAILTQPLPDLETMRADAPLALIDLIYRMLAKNPAERIPSVRLIGAELEAIYQGRVGTPATPTTAQIMDDMPTFVGQNRFATPTAEEIHIKNNLPIQTTPFVGRETELEELDKLVDDDNLRLISILAPGGMGKTRLALETAISQLNKFNNGVYFVELAPLSNADNMPAAIATALEYQFAEDERRPKEQLLDFLQDKQLLLVLDNFEHLLDGTQLVSEILQVAPNVQVLATSRQRLALPGETVFHLGGMEFPDWETPADALKYAAMKLFLNSAQRAQPGFELTEDNLDYIARICRLVQGMPLGIVLAAAWLAMLSPLEIAEELAHGIDFLEDEVGEVPARQQSIRVVMDYSWEMMSSAEQSVFVKLSVFRKGFTREAALNVADANLRILLSLVNKSLIRRDTQSGRYEIHELLRQYAVEKLEASPDLVATNANHATFYAEMLNQQVPLLKGGGQIEAMERIKLEYDNCYAAWNWAITQDQPDILNTMLDGLFLFLAFNHWGEAGFDLFGRAREQWPADADGAPLVAGRLSVRWHIVKDLDLYQQIMERARAIAQTHQNKPEIAFCLRELGWLFGHQASLESEVIHQGIHYFEESLTAYRELGDRYYEAQLLDDIGWAYQRLRDEETRLKYSEQSLELRREVGDTVGLGRSLTGYVFRIWIDQPKRALELIHDAHDLAVQEGNKFLIADTLILQGIYYYIREGDLAKAQQIYTQVLDLSLAINYEFGRRIAQLVLASIICISKNDSEHAWQLIKSALPNDGIMRADWAYFVNGTMAYLSYYASISDFETLTVRLISLLKFTDFSLNIDFLDLLPYTAMMFYHFGDFDYATKLLARNTTDQNVRGFIVQLRKWSVVQDLKLKLQEKLGESAFNAAWEEGIQLDMADIRQYIFDTVNALDDQ